MTDKVLFVDDDPNLLASCERTFRRIFNLETATGAEVALERITAHGPFAVVVSDRHMPGMDGIVLLTRVREHSPDTVRIMLTGNADLEGAIKVVNDGNIFRFLTKPCPSEILGKAVEDALKQYRLVMAEKELLNNTLNGSIKLLTDILSTTDPEAFGRAQAVRDLTSFVNKKFHTENEWEINLAVMLAPIGNITIPPQLLVRAHEGVTLSKVEERLVAQLPETSARLLANIPRLEGVARIIRLQTVRYDGGGAAAGSPKGEALPFGSRFLKILADLAQLQAKDLSRTRALDEMQSRLGWYDPALLNAVRQYYGLSFRQRDAESSDLLISLSDLAPGMVLSANVETRDGLLILCAGHQITEVTLEKVKNFALVSGIKEPLQVENPGRAPDPNEIPS